MKHLRRILFWFLCVLGLDERNRIWKHVPSKTNLRIRVRMRELKKGDFFYVSSFPGVLFKAWDEPKLHSNGRWIITSAPVDSEYNDVPGEWWNSNQLEVLADAAKAATYYVKNRPCP